MIEQKPGKVACCAPIATQRATNDGFGATIKRNNNATSNLKALAVAVLERNILRNTIATDTPKHAQQIGQKNSGFVAFDSLSVSGDLTTDERDHLTAWLTQIGERDPESIAEFWHNIHHKEGAKDYFLGRALAEAQLPLQTKPVAVSCQSCQHFRPFHIHGKGSGTCRAGVRPSGLVHWSETPKQCVLYQGKQ